MNLARALTVSSDVYYYQLGAPFWDARASRTATPSRMPGARRALRHRRRGHRPASPTPRPAQAPARGQPAGVPQRRLAHRRQHQPRHRPGRDGGHAAAAGQRLRHVRQRRHGVQPRVVGQGRRRRRARRCARSQPRAGAHASSCRRRSATRSSPGCKGVVSDGKGTAARRLRRVPARPVCVAGKTGTAQVAKKQDTALFVAFAPGREPAVRGGRRAWRSPASAARSPRRWPAASSRCSPASRSQPVARGRGTDRLMALVGSTAVGDVAAPRRGRAVAPRRRARWSRSPLAPGGPRAGDDLLGHPPEARTGALSAAVLPQAPGGLGRARPRRHGRHRRRRLPACSATSRRVIYVGTIVVLLVVLSPLGSRARGTQAWFQLGPVPVPAVGVRQAGRDHLPRRVLLAAPRRARLAAASSPCCIVAAVPIALIYLQPDLGTALVFVAILMGVLLVAGARPRHLVAAHRARRHRRRGRLPARRAEAVPARPPGRLPRSRRATPSARRTTSTSPRSPSAPAASPARACSRAPRPTSPTCPSRAPTSSSPWSARSSASSARPSLLALFALIVWRTWRTAALAKDLYGTLVCVGVLAMFVFQIFENVGHDHGHHADHRHPPALPVLRRLVHPRRLRRHRPVLNVHMRRFT